eukprot:4125733-Amphidinium_carterae.1
MPELVYTTLQLQKKKASTEERAICYQVKPGQRTLLPSCSVSPFIWCACLVTQALFISLDGTAIQTAGASDRQSECFPSSDFKQLPASLCYILLST